MSGSWESLIHFSADDESLYWAALPLNTPAKIGLSVEGYTSIEQLESGGPGIKTTMKTLLSPVPSTHIPIYCIGLNYKNHAQEAKLKVPKCPPMWYKPAACHANPNETIPIPKQALEAFPDYEGELVIVTRNNMRSVSAEEATSNILGYTIGNDLTARMYQSPDIGGGQFTYAKAFDKFAPMGPRLVHPSRFSISAAKLQTRVNGKTLQDSPLDFIFPIGELISFLSQGTTIPAGSAIMTGTPSGVGWFQEPKALLKDADVVEVEIQPIGILSNKIAFESAETKGQL